jgi:hypothetical protein
MTRYSQLSPLSVKEKLDITVLLITFFAHLKTTENRKTLNLPTIEGKIEPLSLFNFFMWCKNIKNIDLWPRQERISELVNLLQHKNLLIHAGITHGSPPLNNCYYAGYELTKVERKGILFLGRYIGADFIADQIRYDLAYITGTTKKDDRHVGSGVALNENLVLTCAHVIKDMTLDDVLEINGKTYKILKSEIHPTIDFGIIVLSDKVTADNFHKDIALRKAGILEKIIVAGFPKIPRNSNKKRSPIVQKGEMASTDDVVDYGTGEILELFTAVSRPGNSGGPLMSLDGKLLGIVTRSLDRKPEECDHGETSIPFFASVPAEVIFNGFKELELAKDYSIPWENFE